MRFNYFSVIARIYCRLRKQSTIMSRSPGQQESVFKGVFDDEEHGVRDDHDKHNVTQMNRQASKEDQISKFRDQSFNEISKHSASISTPHSSYNSNDRRIDDSYEGFSYNDSQHSFNTSSTQYSIESSAGAEHSSNYTPRVFEHDRKKSDETMNFNKNPEINKRDSKIRGSVSEDGSERSPLSGRSSPLADEIKVTAPTRDRKLTKDQDSFTENKKRHSDANNEMSSGSVMDYEQDSTSSQHGGGYERQESYGSESGDRRGRSDDKERGSCGSASFRNSWEMVSGEDCTSAEERKFGESTSSGSRHGRNEEDRYKKERNFQTNQNKGNWRGTPLNDLNTVTEKNCYKFYTFADKANFDLRLGGSRILDQRFKSFVDLPAGLIPASSRTPTTDWWRSDCPYWNDLARQLTTCGHIRSINELKEKILFSNKGEPWDFSALDKFLRNNKEHLFTIDRMGLMAAQLPNICDQKIPFLKQGVECSITLSRRQIACLLCHAFFCTFPGRNPDPSYHSKLGKWKGKSYDQRDRKPVLPTMNFSGLFQMQGDRDQSQEGKLHCLFNYFQRVTESSSTDPDGCVTFERRVCPEEKFPNWATSEKPFTRLHVRKEGFIEDEGTGMLQVDFANKKVGGGVLGRGCVQEEIRFLICPELIISRLFTEELEYNETLLITGCERYNNFKGYARTFEYTGDHNDKTPSDRDGRKLTQVVAMDAKSYRNPEDQFHPRAIDRELKKAYCGFVNPKKVSDGSLPAVATGNWGCGAFKGDRHVKALIQLMAAAEAGRDVLYITIDDDQLVDDLFDVHQIFKDKRLTVGNAFNMLKNYATDFHKRNFRSNIPKLFDYIKRYNSDVKD